MQNIVKLQIYILSFLISTAYLIYLLERYIGNIWIGFHHEPYSTFKFLDHSSTLGYTYWGRGQPNRQLSERSCTQVNMTGSDFGVWDDVDCGKTNPFICEIYHGNSLPKRLSCANIYKYINTDHEISTVYNNYS